MTNELKNWENEFTPEVGYCGSEGSLEFYPEGSATISFSFSTPWGGISGEITITWSDETSSDPVIHPDAPAGISTDPGYGVTSSDDSGTPVTPPPFVPPSAYPPVSVSDIKDKPLPLPVSPSSY